MVRIRRSLVFGVVLAAVTLWTLGCGRGPSVEILEGEVQRRLDARFEQDVFRVTQFRRLGSAPFRDIERDVSGIFVYYDANLEFLRDYELASWGGLNLGTLAYVLGATPAGVTGLEPAGNRRGNLLRVRGRLGWQEQDGRWIPIAAEPQARDASPQSTLEGTGPLSLLGQVRELVARRRVSRTDSRDDAVVYELRRALQLIDLRFARLDGASILGTGQVTGTYNEFGKAFATYASARGIPLHAHPSAGSVENAFAIQIRRLDFGVVQSDVAEALHKGIEAQQLPLPDLRAVASLWPEVVHVVTLEASGIQTLTDLREKRIAVGQLGSGTRLNAIQIGRVMGLQLADFPSVREVDLAQSIAELESGEVDAVFVTEAVPSRVLQDLTQRRDDVHFVSLDADVLRGLTRDHFAYYGVTVPARTYPGQEEPFRSLGLAAALVTHAATSDEIVRKILDLLLDGVEELSRSYYRAGFISSETARLGIALPLHPAAERFYAERESASARGAALEPKAIAGDGRTKSD